MRDGDFEGWAAFYIRRTRMHAASAATYASKRPQLRRCCAPARCAAAMGAMRYITMREAYRARIDAYISATGRQADIRQLSRDRMLYIFRGTLQLMPEMPCARFHLTISYSFAILQVR